MADRRTTFDLLGSTIQLPAYGQERALRPGRRATPVATILDEFSTLCFDSEAFMVPVSRVDYAKAFDYYKPALLLVESAWNGNSGDWRYHFVGSNGPRQRALDVLEVARDRGIPTVFWNKEDPPHFDEFLPYARHFDYIFTTEGSLLEDYRSAAPGATVGVLPFAAQPAIHHPLRRVVTERGEVAFAGQYFTHKFPERREQMDYLFEAAADHDFTIYSREVGASATYAFPEQYQRFIAGSLPYDMMLDAYRSFRVFLNVNSVPSSQTMCARRVFELSACKTTVLSAPTPAIEAFYAADEVFLAGSAPEAREVLQLLLGDEEYRRRSAHRAWRRTLSGNTYSSRFDQVLEAVGIPHTLADAVKPRVVAVVDDADQASRLAADLERQTTLPDGVLWVTPTDLDGTSLPGRTLPWTQRHVAARDVAGALETSTMPERTPWTVMDGRHRYAPHFLSDLALAWDHYEHDGVVAKPVLQGQQPDTWSDTVGAVGLTTDRTDLLGSALDGLLTGDDATAVTHGPAVLTDDFNIISAQRADAAADWQV